MKDFLDNDFLLTTKTAQHLYHSYAEKMPIIDYHCHISPKEIYEDIKFENLTQLWLLGDHYKWRQMRANGVEEQYITGDASDYDKFVKWAETLDKAIGNPLYHWSHLELRRYFGYKGILSSKNALEVWNFCNEQLKNHPCSARSLILRSNVTHICTTDDPIDDLQYHKAIAEDTTFAVKVLPTFRPDLAGEVEKETYPEYIAKLEEISGVTITSFQDVKAALKTRMEYFASAGCKIADQGLNHIAYVLMEESKIEEIFKKALKRQNITSIEADALRCNLLMFCAAEYHRLNWAMQLHYGCKRDNNTRQLKNLGVNTGFDCINSETSSKELADMLDALDVENKLPKTILYSLNPVDNAYIGTIIGCFMGEGMKGKVQHGCAWWFNDNKTGIQEQMTSLANLGLLGNFIGMLTDSRSFLSYVRHEYFRRILCEMIGNWVENGEYPNDEELLQSIVENICYHNAKEYFEFK